MIRVLHIMDSMGIGGIQSFVLNLYRSIDRNKMQFDFLLHREFHNQNEEEIRKLGGKIYFVPTRREGVKKNKRALKEFFEQHKEYDTVHVHISSLTYIEPLKAATKAGIPVRIVHSHNSQGPKNNKLHHILHELNKRRLHKYATHFFACSDMAAEWFYGGTKMLDKAVFIPNGIRLGDYAFNTEIRNKYRQELGVEHKRVIGHVGRFHYAKNHEFIIEIFKAYAQLDDSAVLMLVGDGDKRADLERTVAEYALTDKVFFLGNRSDVKQLLQTFDLFLLPSRYEGFPVTLIEAQAASLPCAVSDAVTHTVDITGKVRFCKLDAPMDAWTNAIKDLLGTERDRSDLQKVKDAGFDIQDVVAYLNDVYSNVAQQKD